MRNLWIPLLVFLIADVLVTLVVVRRRLAAGIDFKKLRQVSAQVHQKIGEYVPASYGGHAEELPELLSALLQSAAQIAVAQGLILDQSLLERIVTTSMVAHRFARRSEIDAAFQKLHSAAGCAA